VATASQSIDADTIRRQMAQIRRELHEDVQGLVAGAEEAADWRYYVRMYPWIAVGAAMALGYFVVPKRRKIVVEAPQVPVATQNTVEKKERRAGLLGAGFGLLWPLLIRAGQSYAAQFVENWIAQQGVLGPLPQGHPASPQAGPGRPAPGTPGGGLRA
jgi:hypothetical protein